MTFQNMTDIIEDNYTLYELIDPRTNELFYIGITNRSLQKRLTEHCKPSQYKKSPKKRTIIGSIKRDNLKVIIKPIFENLTLEEVLEYEYQMIWKLKAVGYNLANVSEGGNIFIQTKETKKKISLANTGRKWTEKQKHFFLKRKPTFKAVIVTNIETGIETKYNSLLEVEKDLKISKQQICNVLKKRCMTFKNKKFTARYEVSK